MSDRDRNDDLPLIPAGTSVGSTPMAPRAFEVDDDDELVDEVEAEEWDHEAVDDDSELLDTDSPEFDHSLRMRKED